MNRNRLPNLDFSRSRADTKWRRSLVLSILCVFLGIELGLMIWKVEEIESEQSRLFSEQTRLAKRLQKSPDGVISKELGQRLAATRSMMNSLSIPWESLLSALEKAVGENIVVETIRPEVSGKRVEISVVAPGFSDIRSFMTRLAENKTLQQVVLLSETPSADKKGSIRFVLTTIWREEP